MKAYMSAARCSVGMLVAPGRLIILRDTFSDLSPGSVRVVGDFKVAGFLEDFSTEGRERAVQAWLRRFKETGNFGMSDPALVAALRENVLPALEEGEVRAARPWPDGLTLHAFVETNWVVGLVAPAHHRIPRAAELLERARRREIALHLPALCLTKARAPILGWPSADPLGEDHDGPSLPQPGGVERARRGDAV